MRSAAGRRVYEDLVPSHEFVGEETADTLTVDLPGYRKEQIKVQIDHQHGKLKISGERPLEDDRWSRFRKEFQVPENCNASDIRAKFEKGHLYVRLPKSSITEVKGQERPALEAPRKPMESQKPAVVVAKPNGVTEKQEEEEKEKEYKEKVVAGVVKREGGDEMGGAVTEVVQKKEEVSGPAAAAAGDGEGKLNDGWSDELGLGWCDPRHITVNAIVAALVLIGMGLYVSYKQSTMEEDGN